MERETKVPWRGDRRTVRIARCMQVTANVDAVEVKRLNEVKTGDQVVLRVTDALAIFVEKP